VRNDLHGYLEVFNLQESLEEEFSRAKVNLDKKKDKIYSQFDVSKWDITKDVASTLSKDIIHDKASAFKIMLPRENT